MFQAGVGWTVEPPGALSLSTGNGPQPPFAGCLVLFHDLRPVDPDGSHDVGSNICNPPTAFAHQELHADFEVVVHQ